MSRTFSVSEPPLAFAVRKRWDDDHPAAPDLETLVSGAPGVVALCASPDVRVWVVFSGAPTAVRAAARRLTAGPLPEQVWRVPMR
jgi:hypothetical protein